METGEKIQNENDGVVKRYFRIFALSTLKTIGNRNWKKMNCMRKFQNAETKQKMKKRENGFHKDSKR